MEGIWNSASPQTPLPTNAVPVGQTKACLYICRAKHQDLTLATTVKNDQREVYIAWNVQVYKNTEFEILTGDYKWQAVDGKPIPSNAIICGVSKRGEYLFIGRGQYENSTVVGTIDLSKYCLIAVLEDKAICLGSYEILVGAEDQSWQKATFKTIPNTGVIAGQDVDHSVIYVGRTPHAGEYRVAKVIPRTNNCYFAYRGSEVYTSVFEVLTGVDYDWIKAKDDVMPINAICCGISRSGRPLYVGRRVYKNTLTPGLISHDGKSILLTYDGATVTVGNFEVLVKK